MLAATRITEHARTKGLKIDRLGNGMNVIRVGQRVMTGRPISKRVA